MGYAAEHKDEMRAARKARKVEKRKIKQYARRQRRTGSTRLYVGPVVLNSGVEARIFEGGKTVRAAMSHRNYQRATIQGAVAVGGSTLASGNVVLLMDYRIPHQPSNGPVIAEIIDTGKDIRVHLFRCREVRGGASVPVLSIDTRTERGPMPPLMSPASSEELELPAEYEDYLRHVEVSR